jgi:hypothetical protein
MRPYYQQPAKQKGVVVILTAVSLLFLLMMAGIVFEMGRAYKLRSSLQNGVDAAALAAITLYSQVNDQDSARDQARAVLAAHFSATGNETFITALAENAAVEFFSSLQPLEASGAAGPVNFIRVQVRNAQVDLLTSLFSFDTFDLSASAVAGLSPSLTTVCDVSPLLVCGVAPDENGVHTADYLGYSFGQAIALKISTNDESGVGPGNFHLLDTGSGGNAVKDSLAGAADKFCVTSGSTVTTLPGNTVGPVAMGLNARFADANSGSLRRSDIPPDLVRIDPVANSNGRDGDITGGYTAYPDAYSALPDDVYTHDKYENDLNDCQADAANNTAKCATNGSIGRRVISVSMVDCSADDVSGVADLPVLGFGCFFLPQSLTLAGNAGNTVIYGELIEACDGEGDFTGDPQSNGDDSAIVDFVLYKDPGDGDL